MKVVYPAREIPQRVTYAPDPLVREMIGSRIPERVTTGGPFARALAETGTILGISLLPGGQVITGTIGASYLFRPKSSVSERIGGALILGGSAYNLWKSATKLSAGKNILTPDESLTKLKECIFQWSRTSL
jgi:hypothetical protein